jgi:hypothetical protein
VGEVSEAEPVIANLAAAAVTEEARPDVSVPPGDSASDIEESASEMTAEAGQGKDVQGLFARLRENRDQATRAARKTLRDGEDEKGAGAAAAEEAKDEPEPGGGEGPAAIAVSDLEPETTSGASAAATGAEEAKAEAPEAEPDGSVKLLERSDEVTRDVGSSLARKLKRALQDEQNSLLDRLRSMKGPITPGKVLPDPDEHPDHYADAGRPLLQQAARAGAQVAGGLGGHRAASADGADQVDDLADELGRAIAEPLRQRLELAMRSAGDDPAELADALGAAYREWKTQRIEASAHHEVAAAFARGAYFAFPEGSLLRWMVGPAEGPCPDCEDNALAGEQPKGEAWPTGQLYPPAHPGCRCVLVPAAPEGTAGPSSVPSGS